MKVMISLRRITSLDNKRVVACWGLFSDVATAYPSSKVWKPLANLLPVPYEIRKVDGKGLGMIATRAIKQGEIIVIERPILMVPRMLPSYEDMEKYLLQLLFWLEQEDRERIVQLHNCKSLDECGPLAGILRTNALGATFPESQICPQYAAVCLDISRVNHSCSHNANYHFDEESITFSLRAYHDISPGEEITIGYLDEGLTRAERQAELEQKYLFTCTCDMCSAPASLITESDDRRTGVRAHLDFVTSTFDYWRKSPAGERKAKLEDGVVMVNSFLKMMEEEDIHTGRLGVLKVPVYMYATFCDSNNFRIWVGRNLEYLKRWEEISGTKHKAQKSWEGWLTDPTSFPLWDFWNAGVNDIKEKMEKSGLSVP